MSKAMTQANKKRSIHALIEKSKSEISRAIPKHMDIEKLTRVALTTIKQNSKLLSCSETSLIASVMQASQLGLQVDSNLGYAYLVPYGTDCTLIVGYKGLIKLARNSGDVTMIYAECVYEHDEFSYELGLEPKLKHIPNLDDRGKVKCVYAVAKFRDGGSQFVVMTVAEINKIKNKSKAGKHGPWVDHWEEMAKKTCVRRLSKYLPLDSDQYNKAVVLDDQAESGDKQDFDLEISAALPEEEELEDKVASRKVETKEVDLEIEKPAVEEEDEEALPFDCPPEPVEKKKVKGVKKNPKVLKDYVQIVESHKERVHPDDMDAIINDYTERLGDVSTWSAGQLNNFAKSLAEKAN